MRKTYVCGVSYQHEMDHPEIVHFFDSVEDLKKSDTCWLQCGIVEISLNDKGKEISHKWIHDQDFSSWAKPKDLGDLKFDPKQTGESGPQKKS